MMFHAKSTTQPSTTTLDSLHFHKAIQERLPLDLMLLFCLFVLVMEFFRYLYCRYRKSQTGIISQEGRRTRPIGHRVSWCVGTCTNEPSLRWSRLQFLFQNHTDFAGYAATLDDGLQVPLLPMMFHAKSTTQPSTTTSLAVLVNDDNLGRTYGGMERHVQYGHNTMLLIQRQIVPEGKIAYVKRGPSLVNTAVFTNNDTCLVDLMSRMRDDEVKDITQSDALIHWEAGLRMTALGQKHDQKQHDVYRVSQAARTLGHIVLLARQSKPGVSLDDIIQIN